MKVKKIAAVCLVVCLVLAASAAIIYTHYNGGNEKEPEINLSVSSDAFENVGTIPIRYTGNGDNVSPSLKFGPIASGAKTIAIIMDDPDTPMGTFTHWVVWNIPADRSVIPENIPDGATVASLGNANQGRNGYLVNGYRGPKPPKGTGIHAYRFKVYVLDTKLTLSNNAGKKDLLNAMKGHILQYGKLVGKSGFGDK